MGGFFCSYSTDLGGFDNLRGLTKKVCTSWRTKNTGTRMTQI